MNILLIFLCFFNLLFIIIFIIQSTKIRKLSAKPKNNVHFYVARDKSGTLWLYMCKPIRYNDVFREDLSKGGNGLTHLNFRCYGLDEKDYANLKWEDEPVEVFINIED